MKVFIDYKHDYNSKRYFLRSGQVVTVGSSQLADLTLAGANLAPKHFEIHSRADGCTARNLVAPDGVVSVNGTDVDKVELSDGDEIEAGNIVFKIEMESSSLPVQVDAAPTVTAEEPLTSDSDFELAESDVNDTLRKATFSKLAEKPVFGSRLMSDLGERFRLYLVCNFKLMEIEPFHDCDEETDLFKDYPGRVKNTNSLHFVGKESGSDIETQLQSLLGSGKPFLVVFSELEKDELIDKMKFHLAWLANPDNLDFHVEQGSEDFVQGLFGAVSCMMVHASEADGLSLYLNSEKSAGPTEFNLQDALSVAGLTKS